MLILIVISPGLGYVAFKIGRWTFKMSHAERVRGTARH